MIIQFENAIVLREDAADKLLVGQHGFVDANGKGTCLSTTAVFQEV
jgi:hypothetical protein